MPGQWYFVRDGKKQGPVSIEILKTYSTWCRKCVHGTDLQELRKIREQVMSKATGLMVAVSLMGCGKDKPANMSTVPSLPSQAKGDDPSEKRGTTQQSDKKDKPN